MGLEDIVREDEMMKRYLVTGAQYMAPVNHKFLDTLESYARKNDAEIIVLPVYYKKTDEPILHERLQNYTIIDRDYKLNDNIQIKKFDVRPQSINPETGLARFARSDRTSIFASPKQRMKVLPNDKTLPKVLMTTGFCTKPTYSSGFVISSKAKHDHKYGAVVVELEDDEIFHYRHIDSQVNGKFCDLNKIYDGNKVKTIRPTIVFGDTHAAHLDPKVYEANLRMIEQYKPKNLILHDVFDGASINHWTEKKQYSKVKEYDHNKLSLINEGILTLDVINTYAAMMPRDGKVYIVKSNHDERIDRWLDEGRYLNEPQNNIIGHQLYVAQYQGRDVLEELLNYSGNINKKVWFLPRDQGLKVHGFQVGYHGDERFNGGRGSITSIENAYGKSVVGHMHTPQVLRDTYVVGTNSILDVDYNKGHSAWMQTNAIVNPLGKAQLVNIIDGRWTK